MKKILFACLTLLLTTALFLPSMAESESELHTLFDIPYGADLGTVQEATELHTGKRLSSQDVVGQYYQAFYRDSENPLILFGGHVDSIEVCMTDGALSYLRLYIRDGGHRPLREETLPNDAQLIAETLPGMLDEYHTVRQTLQEAYGVGERYAVWTSGGLYEYPRDDETVFDIPAVAQRLLQGRSFTLNEYFGNVCLGLGFHQSRLLNKERNIGYSLEIHFWGSNHRPDPSLLQEFPASP